MPFVKRVTGPGITERVNMVSADLGIVRYDPNRKAYAYVFGDNFAERYMKGEWQSPSIIMYDADHNLLGIPIGTTDILSSGNRRQAIPYQHNEDGISTILPCDLQLLNGRWILSAMIVGLGGLGDEKATQFFESPDLMNFTKFGPSLEHPGHPGNVMITHDRQGDCVYIFGTGGLARNRGIWLWRCDADTFPEGLWEPWGFDGMRWKWGTANERTPIIDGRFGELSLRFLQGNPVLSFFDAQEYCCSALTVPKVTDDWSKANRVEYARGADWPQLYGGYITDDSRLNQPNGMKFIVSQWHTGGSNDPYHVIALADSLQAKGPLLEAPAEPEAPPTLEEGPMTPQDLYELLLRELSASGSVKITTPEGDNITLREAVEQIFVKERGLVSLDGRPRHPGQADDQLGHVINIRAEGLFTQACVAALADKAGIDTAKLYRQVQESL